MGLQGWGNLPLKLPKEKGTKKCQERTQLFKKRGVWKI